MNILELSALLQEGLTRASLFNKIEGCAILHDDTTGLQLYQDVVYHRRFSQK